MLNQVVMIGRLKYLDKDKMILHMDSDAIDVEIFVGNNLYQNLKDIAQPDSMIGFKGRICVNTEHELSLYAEQVTVLQQEKNHQSPKQKKKRNEYER